MKKRLILSLTLALIVSLLFAGVVSAEKEDKVDICHKTGAGKYLPLNVNGNALQAHLDHGDAMPGDIVLGDPVMMFNDACELVEYNVDVAGTWEGASGLAGSLDFPFTLEITQDEFGNVSGTIDYGDYGVIRFVSGWVNGFEFYFVTYDDELDPTLPYWADCNCEVSFDGTYFHGYGLDSNGLEVEFEATKLMY